MSTCKDSYLIIQQVKQSDDNVGQTRIFALRNLSCILRNLPS